MDVEKTLIYKLYKRNRLKTLLDRTRKREKQLFRQRWLARYCFIIVYCKVLQFEMFSAFSDYVSACRSTCLVVCLSICVPICLYVYQYMCWFVCVLSRFPNIFGCKHAKRLWTTQNTPADVKPVEKTQRICFKNRNPHTKCFATFQKLILRQLTKEINGFIHVHIFFQTLTTNDGFINWYLRHPGSISQVLTESSFLSRVKCKHLQLC